MDIVSKQVVQREKGDVLGIAGFAWDQVPDFGADTCPFWRASAYDQFQHADVSPADEYGAWWREAPCITGALRPAVGL